MPLRICLVLVAVALLVSATAAPPAPARTRRPRTATCGVARLGTRTLDVYRLTITPAPRTARARLAACRTAGNVVRAVFHRYPTGRLLRRRTVSHWRCTSATRRVVCSRSGRSLTVAWRVRRAARPGSVDGSGNGGGRWYSDTIPYFNQSAAMSADIARAAAAWNASGVRIHWVAVPEAQARVIIHEEDVSPAIGTGTMPTAGTTIDHAEIKIEPGLLDTLRAAWPDATAHQLVAVVAAHEMGHVMGLDHEESVCATMNPGEWSKCAIPSTPWLYRCRVLEPSDVQRAAAVYGGSPGNVGPELCKIGADPPPVTSLTAADNGSGAVHMQWHLPDDPSVTFAEVWARPDGGCPGAPDEPGAFLAASTNGDASRDQSTDASLPGSGHFCLGVFTFGDFEFQGNHSPRPGAGATIGVDFTAGP